MFPTIRFSKYCSSCFFSGSFSFFSDFCTFCNLIQKAAMISFRFYKNKTFQLVIFKWRRCNRMFKKWSFSKFLKKSSNYGSGTMKLRWAHFESKSHFSTIHSLQKCETEFYGPWASICGILIETNENKRIFGASDISSILLWVCLPPSLCFWCHPGSHSFYWRVPPCILLRGRQTGGLLWPSS